MRFPSLTPLLALAALTSALAAPQLDPQPEAAIEVPKGAEKDAAAPAPAPGPASPADNPVVAGDTAAAPVTDGSDADDASGTTFSGHKVPPLTELSGESIDKDIASGYWLVEFFSPYCHHCKAFAPTWQTAFEFYYASTPLADSSANSAADSPDSTKSLNSFTRYYDFKFAKLDCVAFGTACADKEIHSFPTIVLFKDGKAIDKKVGGQDIKTLSKWIESTLETIRPGSRPKGGPKLPKVGAHHVDGGDSGSAAKHAPAKDDKAADKAAASTSTTSTASSTKSTLVAQEHNPSGRSIPLTAETFQTLVTTTHDPWFIKFYAPWCHHCQAMGPNWMAMAKEMKGRLNIGEVNCEAEKRLCKDVHVKGYPTLVYFQAGERVEYEGLRGVGDLIKYANQAVDAGNGVEDVTLAEFEEMEKKEEVIFLYFYDHATTTEDFAALERLLLSLIGHAKLVRTHDADLEARFRISTWPRLVVSRDTKPTYFTPLAPKDIRDFRKVLNWMQSVWQPIVPELTAANAREIMDGRLVVLAILSRERSDEFIIARRELKQAALEWIDKETQAFQLERQELRDAKQLRIEEAEDRNDQRALRAAKQIVIDMDEVDWKQVGFAWVDGVFWERWIKTTFGISVKEGEKVVINDEDNQRYWDVTITGNPIVPSRVSILETLPKVVANPPKISPVNKNSFFGHIAFKVRSGLAAHPLITMGVAAVMFVGLGIWGRGAMRRGSGKSFGSGGFFTLNEKDGLLGAPGAAAGKVD
ncbi:hypothetical protein AAFC00_002605 [Neodothiora populina]|uniref:Thioredoxin domain-containing protein n=1 Tax=Neodothiora populina TaxID=2781224 RepID=A0ABR3P7L5_9PEZI